MKTIPMVLLKKGHFQLRTEVATLNCIRPMLFTYHFPCNNRSGKHDPVDDGDGRRQCVEDVLTLNSCFRVPVPIDEGKITKLEHHVSRETEPNKLETGTPMDRINRNGIGSHLGTTILITIPSKQGFYICRALSSHDSQSSCYTKEHKQPSEAKRCIHTNNTDQRH